MSKRILLSIAFVASTAFALTAAAPAYACGKDCDCARKAAAEQPQKKDATPAKPADKPATTEKKAALGAGPAVRVAANATCNCGPGGKGCTCPKGQCECANCKAHHKHS